MTLRILTPDELLAHWRGHRALTRKVIAAFPEEHLFTSAPAPPMRPFGELMWEVHLQTDQVLTGLRGEGWGKAIPEWVPSRERADLLTAWDDLSAQMETTLPAVTGEGWAAVVNAHHENQTALAAVFGELDNEVHHRGQGMVYLRLLGVQPPDFWDRA